jgi:hypothetical protein
MELGGLATINFDINGPIRSPVLRGDIFVDDLRVGPLEIEAATASPIRVEKGILAVEEIRLRDGPMEATGTASWPLTVADEGAEDAGPKAELHLTEASYAPVPAMLPAVFDADFYLVGDRILIYDRKNGNPNERRPGIRGQMGQGTFTVEGEMVLREMSPARWQENWFDMTCTLSQLELVFPGIATGRLGGTLLLANSMQNGLALLTTPEDEPLVVSHAVLGIPRAGQIPSVGASPFSPKVDVRVLVGEEVRFRYGPEQRPTEVKFDRGQAEPGQSPTGYVDLGGQLSAQGLTLNGMVESHEGQLVFPNGILTLRRGSAWIDRAAGEPPRIRVSAEADGRVGDYYVSLNPSGQIYPLAGGGELGSPHLALNAAAIPYLEPAFVMALLAGPVVAPTRGGGRDFTALLGEPGGRAGGGGQVTGIMIPPLGSALGAHDVSLDVALQGQVRLRLGERIFRRFLVSYVSPISGPEEARMLRVTYEVTPRWSLGWSVDELDRARWEAQAFLPF